MNLIRKSGVTSGSTYLFESFEIAPITADPQGIIKAIEVAVAIFGLFKGKEDSLDEIGHWVNELSTKIDKINEGLKDVRRLLEDLKVYIEQLQIQNDEIDVLAIIQTYAQTINELKQKKGDQSAEQTFRGFHLDLNQKVNRLKSYSFASALTVAYALKVETELISLLSFSNESKNMILKSYKNYFEECVNDKKQGSIANVLSAAKNTREKLLTDSRSWSKFTVSYLYILSQENYMSGGGGDRHPDGIPMVHTVVYLASFEFRLTGDLSNGYSGETKLVGNSLSGNYYDRRGNFTLQCLPGIDVATATAAIYFNDQLQQINNQSALFQKIDGSYRALEKVEDVCSKMIEVCTVQVA